MRHILNTKDISKEEVEKILAMVPKMEEMVKSKNPERPLANKIIACVFYEPSTRTRLSFESASLRLGAQIISVENARENSSSHKGETIEDATKIISQYADLIVMRHHEIGAVARGASTSLVPVINAGDGAGEHPTQALLDLYTIKKEHGRLDNLKISFVGDIKNSRTIHSLVPLLAQYEGNTFYFVSPKELAMTDEMREFLRTNKIDFGESDDIDMALKEADVLYMTRVQKERFKNTEDYQKLKDFILTPEYLKSMKKDATIMHPLPRVGEIDPDIDSDPRASYFRQAQNGLYVRMALLLYALELL